MSDSEKPKRREKLPPLNIDAAKTEATAKRRKKKLPSNDENDDSVSQRTVPPRTRSRARTSSRTRSGRDEDSDDGDSARREIPQRSKKPRPVTVTDEDVGTGKDDSDRPNERPKKKRKPKQPRADSQEALVGNGTNPDETSPRESKPKKKRKRKPQVGAHVGPSAVGLEAELDDLDEDIVDSDNTESMEDNKWSTPAIRSQPVNKLYIEQKSGFKSTNKAKVAQRRLQELQRAEAPPEPPRTKSTIQFAISSHRIFKTITLFLQGLLSGVCLWQIITVYMLSNHGYDVLLDQYYKLALPVQSMYYFLLALSTVAVFDRNDVVRPTRRFVLRSATMQSGAIACLFYLAGLVISLAAARTDDKIGLYAKQPELWEDIEARDSELKTWVILNLVRGLLPILGWFVVSLRPQTDRLIKNLEQADENAIGEDDRMQEGGINRDVTNVRGVTNAALRV